MAEHHIKGFNNKIRGEIMTILVEGSEIKRFNFSAGECYVQLPSSYLPSIVNLYAKLNCSDDIMSLLLIVDAIRRHNSKSQINLTIPYFPYARQDRVCNLGESLSVKVMADLINSLNCQSVTICDPHSDVTPALINNCTIKSLEEIVINSALFNFIESHNLCLVSPDAGAEKKILKLNKSLAAAGINTELICATKVRNVSNGEITSVKFFGYVADKKLIILDDICDGGKTFVELAKKLLQGGAKEVYLYVTHGIFSKGFEELKKYFKHIYCYHLLNEANNDEILTIIEGIENEY